MSVDPYYGEFHRPHEARFHNSVFDTVSRPLSRQSSNRSQSQQQFSDVKIPWNHYGKKLRLYFSKGELDRSDLFQTLLRKVTEQIPNFQGAIAYNNREGRQNIIFKDNDVRAAMREMGNRLTLYSTVVPDKGYIAAADIRGGGRSQSVPPQNHNNRYSPDNRGPSSMDSNYHYREQQQQHHSPQNFPPPTPGPFGGNGYSHSVTHSYNQPIANGMPPHNPLLYHFLTGGHYPFTKFSWVGPNKYHNFGPYPYKHFYNKGGWGPSW